MRCLGRHKFAFRGSNKGLPWDIYHPKPGLDGNEMYEMIYTTIPPHSCTRTFTHRKDDLKVFCKRPREVTSIIKTDICPPL